MVTLSERPATTTVRPGHSSARVPTNPMRRGPVVLATDGTAHDGAAAVAAQLIAARLNLPLEVVSVLEGLPTLLGAPPATSDERHREARATSVRGWRAWRRRRGEGRRVPTWRHTSSRPGHAA